MVTRGERQNSYYTDHTMLTPPQRAAYLVISKISVGRDLKNPTTSFNGQTPTLNDRNPTHASIVQSRLTSFKNPQILRTISSGHYTIHTPALFPVWEFIMTMVISFARERKTAHNDSAPGLRDSNSSKLYQTE